MLVISFLLKQKNGDSDAEPKEVTVTDYYRNVRDTSLQYSDNCPCINVGKPKRPTYIPIEVI